jgi:hypothetical protein
MAIENKAYELKIVASKSNPKHTDLTKPLQSKEGGSEYFIVEVLALKKMIDGVMRRPQKRPFTMVIFNSPDQRVLYNDLLDAVADEANYTKGETGLTINTGVMGIVGKIVERKTGFVYKVLLPDGKPLKLSNGPHKGEDTTRSVVRVFVHEEEDEEVRIQREINRIPDEAIIKGNSNDDESDKG